MQPLERSSTPSLTSTSASCDDDCSGGWPSEGKLPPGWEVGRTARQIARVWWTESRADHGEFPICPAPTPKGYWQVYLGRWHPYAKANGLQYLHRYVMMRLLGRVLDAYEHVHHRPGAALDTTDPRDLKIVEELHHAHFHYGVRVACGREIEVWQPHGPDGRFTPYPDDERVEEIFAEMERGGGLVATLPSGS